jgi:hypothetical protein
MKTNHLARIKRIRTIMIGLALVAVAAMDIWLGASLVSRIGHPTGLQTDGQAVPNADFQGVL